MKKKDVRYFKKMTVRYALITAACAMAVFFSVMGPLSVHAAQNDFPMETPLWVGPYDIYIHPELNIAFPDTGCAYWSSKLTMPEGAKLELLGSYAHARYFSINSYDMLSGAPTDALCDVQIVPDPGSENPYLPGAKRNSVYNREFTITILNEFPPEDPAERLPNTLYAKSGDQGSLALGWRIYVMDKNRDITGGVGLPEPRVILAGGEVLEGQAVYDALSIDHTPFAVMLLPDGLYPVLRSGAYWGIDLFKIFGSQPGPVPYPIVDPVPTDLAAFPAKNPADVRKTFDINYEIMKIYLGINLDWLTGTPPVKVAQYSNLDNQYLSIYISREYGELAVVRGKAPVTPKTFQRDPFMDGNVDMRYWSVTTNESLATTKVVDGVYDEEVPVDENGCYTIVVCLNEDRPSNSYERNGVQWLNWGEAGDGAGHLKDGVLVIRNMLPSPDFAHAIQNITVTGEEESVMGDYFPEIQYMSTEEFEALGHRPWKNLP